MMSTNEVLDHHLQSFAARSIDGLLADYSPDSVFFTPNGTLIGLNAIQPLFEALVQEFAQPDSSFTMLHRSVEGDCAYILWTAETRDNSYELAADTFLVRNGKIAMQSFAAKVRPKH